MLGLIFDNEHWQIHFERSESQVRQLNDRVSQLEASEQQNRQHNRRYERLERRYDRVRSDPNQLRKSMQEVMGKNTTPFWAVNKVLVRNYAPADIQDLQYYCGASPATTRAN